MRGLWIVATALVVVLPAAAHSQALRRPSSVHELRIAPGPYGVGFRLVELRDSTRIFEGDPLLGLQPRPIAAFVWYPADPSADAQRMKYGEYVYLNSLRTGFRPLTARRRAVVERELLADYARHGLTAERLAEELAVETWAVRDLPPASGRFPLIAYGPGLGDPAYDNSVLAEYLASHGYIFMAVPTLGWNHTRMKSDTASIANYARDFEVLLAFGRGLPFADADRIATMGYSWGGMANVLVQMRNPAVRAVVSIDGSIAYHYTRKLEVTGFAQPDRMNVPFLMLKQKPRNWPEDVKSRLDTTFVIWDQLRYSDAWLVEFRELVHNDFSSKWLRLAPHVEWEREPNDQETRNRGYDAIALYVHRFLDAHLRDDAESRTFLQRLPEQNGLPPGMLSVTHRAAVGPAPTLSALTRLAARRGLQAADTIVAEIRASDPGWTLEETDLVDWSWILLAEGQCQDAAGVLRMAMALHPSSIPIVDLMAEAQLLMGERSRAVATFQRSLELKPGGEFATLRLEQLRAGNGPVPTFAVCGDASGVR